MGQVMSTVPSLPCIQHMELGHIVHLVGTTWGRNSPPQTEGEMGKEIRAGCPAYPTYVPSHPFPPQGLTACELNVISCVAQMVDICAAVLSSGFKLY